MNDSDLLKLEELIYSAAKNSFSKTIEIHKKELFYCFAIYTSDSLSYVAPTSFTEDGLKQVIQKYQTIPSFSKYSEEKLYKELRWSPCDSPLHLEFEENFDEAYKLLSGFVKELHELFNQDRMDEFEESYSKVKEVFFKVLLRLDKENFFEKANKREKLVLNILMGDQSDEEILSNAKKLNPKVVYENFKKNYADGNHQNTVADR